MATLPTGQRKRATFTLRLQKLNITTNQPSVFADIISKPPQFSRSLPSNLKVKRGFSQGYTFPPVLNPDFMQRGAGKVEVLVGVPGGGAIY